MAGRWKLMVSFELLLAGAQAVAANPSLVSGMALVAGVGIGAHALATVVSCAAFRVWRRAAPPGARAARKEEPP